MHNDETRKDFEALFPDKAAHDHAVRELDLEHRPDEGLARRTVAVFRCSQLAAESRRRSSPGAMRRSVRLILATTIVALLVLRAGAGIFWLVDRFALTLAFLPGATFWQTLRQFVVSTPDYSARIERLASRPMDVEVAAVHQLGSLLIGTLLWGGLALLLLLMVRDLIKRRRHRPGEADAGQTTRPSSPRATT